MATPLESLTRDRLLQLAADRGVRVRRTARKAEIVAALTSAGVQGPLSTVQGPPSTVQGPKAGDLGRGTLDSGQGIPAPHGNLPPSAPAENGQFTATRAKFDFAGDAPAPALGDLPWGYGDTRVVAMPRDPLWLYAYWEATDEAIADGRRRLGPGGPSAFFVLRVYDTTFRTFDGTNAHSYFDIAVDRAWNNYFVNVGRPRSTFHVDIGMKSHEGYFAVLARSNPAEMPSDAVSGDDRAEWMTVRGHQPLPPPYRHRHVPRPPAPARWHPPAGSTGGEAREVGAMESDFTRILAALMGGEAARGEWFEQVMGGRVVRWVRWTSGRRRTAWRAGPFALPRVPRGPIEVWFRGERRVVRLTGGGERVVFGPWQVVITEKDARGEWRVLDSWRVEIAWTTEAGFVRTDTPVIYRRIFGSYHRRQQLGDGSEIWVREEAGSSEEAAGGSSEWFWVGGSAMAFGGASETLGLGSSGLMLGGASEFAFAGASERQWPGSSENLFLGASGMLFAGSSGLGSGSGAGAFAGGPAGTVVSAGGPVAGFAAPPQEFKITNSKLKTGPAPGPVAAAPSGELEIQDSGFNVDAPEAALPEKVTTPVSKFKALSAPAGRPRIRRRMLGIAPLVPRAPAATPTDSKIQDSTFKATASPVLVRPAAKPAPVESKIPDSTFKTPASPVAVTRAGAASAVKVRPVRTAAPVPPPPPPKPAAPVAPFRTAAPVPRPSKPVRPPVPAVGKASRPAPRPAVSPAKSRAAKAARGPAPKKPGRAAASVPAPARKPKPARAGAKRGRPAPARRGPKATVKKRRAKPAARSAKRPAGKRRTGAKRRR